MSLDKNSIPVTTIDLTLVNTEEETMETPESVVPQWRSSEDDQKIISSLVSVLDEIQLTKVAEAIGTDISDAVSNFDIAEKILIDILREDEYGNISVTDTIDEIKTAIDDALISANEEEFIPDNQYDSLVEFTEVFVNSVNDIVEEKKEIYFDSTRFASLDETSQRRLELAVNTGRLQAVTQERDWAREELEGLDAPTYDPITGEPVSPFNIENFIDQVLGKFEIMDAREWKKIEDEIDRQFDPEWDQIEVDTFKNFLEQQGLVGYDGPDTINPFALIERLNSMLSEDAGKPTTFIQLLIDTLRDALAESQMIRNDFDRFVSLSPGDKLKILDITDGGSRIIDLIEKLEELNNRTVSPPAPPSSPVEP